MSFTWIDVALLIAILLFVLQGWRHGFILVLGGIVSFIGGIIAAAWGLRWFSGLFNVAWASHPVWAIVVFVLILIFVSRLMQWIFGLLDRAWSVASIIPFLGPLNRLLGAVLGLFEGGLFGVMIAYLVVHFVHPTDLLQTMDNSGVLQFFVDIAERVEFLLPSVVL